MPISDNIERLKEKAEKAYIPPEPIVVKPTWFEKAHLILSLGLLFLVLFFLFHGPGPVRQEHEDLSTVIKEEIVTGINETKELICTLYNDLDLSMPAECAALLGG